MYSARRLAGGGGAVGTARPGRVLGPASPAARRCKAPRPLSFAIPPDSDFQGEGRRGGRSRSVLPAPGWVVRAQQVPSSELTMDARGCDPSSGSSGSLWGREGVGDMWSLPRPLPGPAGVRTWCDKTPQTAGLNAAKRIRPESGDRKVYPEGSAGPAPLKEPGHGLGHAPRCPLACRHISPASASTHSCPLPVCLCVSSEDTSCAGFRAHSILVIPRLNSAVCH